MTLQIEGLPSSVRLGQICKYYIRLRNYEDYPVTVALKSNQSDLVHGVTIPANNYVSLETASEFNSIGSQTVTYTAMKSGQTLDSKSQVISVADYSHPSQPKPRRYEEIQRRMHQESVSTTHQYSYQPTKRRHWPKTATVAIVLTVIATVLGLIYIPRLFSAKPVPTPEQQETPSALQPSPELIAVGSNAPDFILSNTGGESVSLKDLGSYGYSLILNFWEVG